MNHLSTNLKRMRTHQGITQAEAARRLGLLRARYSSWEAGAVEPSIDMMLACCTMYRMGVGIMLTKDLSPLTKEDINKLVKP
jgi:transcriptional regulator with XRE-family HTH domain